MPLNCLTYEVSRPPRWNTFLAGLALDVIGGLLLVGVGPHLYTEVALQPVASIRYVTLVAPITAPVAHRASPQRVRVVLQVAKLETPKLSPRPAVHVEAPQPPKIAPHQPDLPKIATAVAPAGLTRAAPPVEVQTNVFGSAGSPVATVQKPPREVQTGGFGDPNGIAGHGDPKRNTVTLASVGSFDLPSGPGKGNGTGGSRGVSRTIRSSGFSDGVASPGPHGRGNGGAVVSSGFGDAVAQTGNSDPQRAQRKSELPELRPVEIVYKPRPAYTAEARQLRVEGEVLLDVIFTASGSLHINRVVKGLGYGLDDTARIAAQHIQFRPARRDGQPYDCAALVHIVFELAD